MFSLLEKLSNAKEKKTFKKQFKSDFSYFLPNVFNFNPTEATKNSNKVLN